MFQVKHNKVVFFEALLQQIYKNSINKQIFVRFEEKPKKY